MLHEAAISKCLEATAMGGDLEFTLNLGSGIRVSINEITGDLVVQHHRGEEKDAVKSDINVVLDREEWGSIITNTNVIVKKIKLYNNNQVFNKQLFFPKLKLFFIHIFACIGR